MSFLKKYRIIIIVCTIYFLLSENNLTGSQAQVAAITDAQREEIQKLRSDLQEAFDVHEEATLKEKGIVVQPDWLQDDVPIPDSNGDVTVTDDRLKEAEALRDEINKAIEMDIYVASVQKTSAGSTQTIKDFEKHISLEEEHDPKKIATDAVVSAAATNPTLDQQQMSANDGPLHQNGNSDADEDGPNIVEASGFLEPDIDIRKLQKLEISKRRTREVLVLESIEEDFTFDLGDDIEEWEHIMHGGEEYFVGRRLIDLLIVRKNAAKYESGKVLHVGETISYLETYSYWNTEQQQQEGVILVSSNDKILWYRADNATGYVELYWEWVVGNTISGLTFFTSENNEYLAVSSNQSSRAGFYALNIYQFELHTREFWIAQRMQLQYPCGEVTILDTGRDIILAVAQNNTAAIYTFNPHIDATDHIRFKLLRHIESEGIGLESIAGFQMGGRSYLALGGLQPQILLYQQGDLVSKTILGNHFGIVELFLPVPARTYRDDMILLVQHRVDFGTHDLTVVETLIWNGEAFEATTPVPCHIGQHIMYGASCMLDIQRNEGLKGAALLRRNDEIYVIVPRDKTESGLFHLHIKLLAKNSELLDLKDIFEFLQDWVREQDDLVATAQRFLSLSNEEISQIEPDLSELDVLTTPELTFNGDVGEIYLNDYKWTEDDTNTELDMLMNAIEQLEHELTAGRHKREISHYELDIDNIEVEDLTVEQVNYEKFFIQNGNLDFEGVIKVENLEVLEHVSVQQSRQIMQESLEVDGDIEFIAINGIPWSEIEENLIFRDAIMDIPQLEVNGEVLVEDHLIVESLNGLSFPDDYLWSSGSSASVITAEKTFNGTLAANAVDTDGLINGVNPLDAITLSEPQDWLGMPTFKHLEVTEKLELNGTVIGANLTGVPDNPTLVEGNLVPANCLFHHLEVQGTLHLQENYDTVRLAPLLQNVVQLPSDPIEEISIPSEKMFSTVTFPIDFNVGSSEINDIPIEEFSTMHTQQNLRLSTLQGYVYFNNLTTTGLYDGVNIEELLEKSIKIDEPQKSTKTQLNFVDTLEAKSLNVISSLNDVAVPEGYQTLHENLVVPFAQFDYLISKIAHIPGDITGNGQLNGIQLQEFLKKRDWHENSTKSGNIFLSELTLENGLQTNHLYGIESELLLNYLNEVDDVPEMILDGKLQVDHVIVMGDVQLHQLNNQTFDENFQSNVIWLNRPNYPNTDFRFLNPVEINGDLAVVGDYNDNNLPVLIDDMVFRSIDGTHSIVAPKSFVRDVYVMGRTQIDAINGVPFDKIATRQGGGAFQGPLQINGNLLVRELELSGNLNDYPVDSLRTLIRHDKHLQTFVLQGEVEFPHQMDLNDLTVYGHLNDMPNTSSFFGDLVFRNSNSVLKGHNTFKGRVTIERGAYVSRLNDLDLLALLNNIAFIHESQTLIINTPIIFEDSIVAREVIVKDTMTGSNISGCSMAEWLNETLRVDRNENITNPLTFTAESLDGNSLHVNHLNDIDFSKIITLHTEQNLSDALHFSELYLDGTITTSGLVNGVNLQKEYENTLKTHGNQNVTTPLTAQSVQVLGNLVTKALVNTDKDLNQVAVLNNNLEFISPLYFQYVTARNLLTNDTISGIDVKQWFDETLWSSQRPQQHISGNWSVNTLTIRSSPATEFNYMPYSSPYNAFMRNMQSDKDFATLRKRITKALKRSTKRGYFIKHFDIRPKMELHTVNTSEEIFTVKMGNEDFLLLNSGCNMIMYKWMAKRGTYTEYTSFESGRIDDVFAVENENGQYLITNSQNIVKYNCSFVGLNIWQQKGNNISHIHNFGHTHTSIMSTNTNSTTKLYTLDAEYLKEISLVSPKYEHTNLFKLPNSTANNTNFKFIRSATHHGQSRSHYSDYFLLTNGEQIILLPRNTTGLREKRADLIKYSLPLHYQRSVSRYAGSLTESTLKPNATAAKTFAFSDFKNLLERILIDLVYRLDLEMNITQLSIPESDLFDEHLVEDFLAIMTELQKQQIYPPALFDDLNLHKLRIPGNPAQVLAIRTVQIIWPVIVEMEEIHGYLRHNVTDEHPVCSCISKSLGTMVRDVLILANGQKTDQNSMVLMAVIERIRKFQKEVEDYAAALKDDDSVGVAADSTLIANTSIAHNGTLLALNEIYLSNFNNTEIVSIEVGATEAPLAMLAVINNSPLGSTQRNYLHLYMDFINPQLHQSIPVQQPHSLVAFRIRDDTLLAFIDGCCTIKVLIYRGVEDFIEFAKFTIDAEVKKLFSLTLNADDGNLKLYLATMLHDKVNFYELVVVGSKQMP